MNKKNHSKRTDAGLLLMRIGVGLIFILHGYPKLLGGPPKWKKLGETMEIIGISSYPEAWGLLAAMAETLGGTLLILGLYTPLTCMFLTFTMVMATGYHLDKQDSFTIVSHPLTMVFVFLSMTLIGAGRYSLDGLRFPAETNEVEK